MHDSDRTLAGIRVGAVAFGCWRMTTPDVGVNRAILGAALDHGMNLVDVADVYGADDDGRGFGAVEDGLGAAFAGAPGLRDRCVLVTKGGVVPGSPYNSQAAYLRGACESSLKRLGTDHVDLYLVHRPDVFAHPDEVAGALVDLVRSGKARAVGVSNHTPSQTALLAARLPPDVPLAADQFELSPVRVDPMLDGTLDGCLLRGTLPMAWSPLAGGRLVGGKGDATVHHELLTTLDTVAHQRGVSRATVAVAFVLAHPARPVAIVGTQQAARLAELVAARDLTLERSELYRIVEASIGERLP